MWSRFVDAMRNKKRSHQAVWHAKAPSSCRRHASQYFMAAPPTVFRDTHQIIPVDNVSIQSYGDLALIRAENDYELKDGRKGANRYADIWLKRDGQWQCIAAHIGAQGRNVTVRVPGRLFHDQPGAFISCMARCISASDTSRLCVAIDQL